MNKEDLKLKLKKFNYRCKEQSNTLTVNLGSSLDVIIEFSENDRIIISDKLRGYNILTGIWSMSVKGSIVFNSIQSVIYSLIFLYINYNLSNIQYSFFMLLFFILAVGFIILWTTYYLVKLENFKTLIQIWDN